MSIEFKDLPHWARAAFAARCARAVWPLFQAAWPDVMSERRASFLRAIELAERSAADGHPAPGLRESMIDCLMSAGRAQVPHLVRDAVEAKEPNPPDRDSSIVASLAAKVAEKAAETAHSDPVGSLAAVREAYGFAFDAIHAAGEEARLDRLEDDLAALRRVVRQGRWTDATTVSPALFERVHRDEGPRRPWWKFWP